MIGELGGTAAQLGAALGITESAVSKRPDLLLLLKKSGAEANQRVEQSLYRRACGYTLDEKHYPSSEVACIFWLKNRDPARWREKSELSMTQELAGVPNDVGEGLRRLARAAAAKKP
jgi:hypothetical protein